MAILVSGLIFWAGLRKKKFYRSGFLPETTSTDVLLVTALAGIGAFVCVKALVQLQVDKLGELGRTQVACVGLLT